MTWCLIRDVHWSYKTTTLYQDPAFQRQPSLSYSWAFIPTSHMSTPLSQNLSSHWGFVCWHFQTSEIHLGCPTSQPWPPQPPELCPLKEGAVKEKKIFNPHQALPNSGQRITLEKLTLKQLWSRSVNLRGAGWDHPLPSVVFWLKTPNRHWMAPDPALKHSCRKIYISSSCCIFLFFSQAFPWLAPGFPNLYHIPSHLLTSVHI